MPMANAGTICRETPALIETPLQPTVPPSSRSASNWWTPVTASEVVTVPGGWPCARAIDATRTFSAMHRRARLGMLRRMGPRRLGGRGSRSDDRPRGLPRGTRGDRHGAHTDRNLPRCHAPSSGATPRGTRGDRLAGNSRPVARSPSARRLTRPAHEPSVRRIPYKPLPRVGRMPMPRRSAADVLGVFLGGALSVFVPDGAAFAEPLPAGLQVSFPSLLAATANEKEKVSKPPPAPPSKSKPDHSTGDHRKDE